MSVTDLRSKLELEVALDELTAKTKQLTQIRRIVPELYAALSNSWLNKDWNGRGILKLVADAMSEIERVATTKPCNHLLVYAGGSQECLKCGQIEHAFGALNAR